MTSPAQYRTGFHDHEGKHPIRVLFFRDHGIDGGGDPNWVGVAGMARLRGIGGTLVLDADGLGKLAARDRGACKRFEAAHKHRSKIVTAASTLPEVLRGGTKDAAVQQAPEHALDALEPEIYEAERPLRRALLHELLDELAAEF